MFVGLVQSRGWEPPEDTPAPQPRRRRRLPWQPVAWFAAWCWLLVISRVVEDALGPVAGYAALLGVVALGFWRVERWCSSQYWLGLRDYRL